MLNSLLTNCTYLATWKLTDSLACAADVNLSPVSRKAVLRCLIWAFSGLKREVNFEFSFDLSGKLTINYGFLTGPQIPIHGWGLEQGFWCCLADRLNQRIVKSVVQDTDSPALRILHRILNSILEDFGLGSC